MGGSRFSSVVAVTPGSVGSTSPLSCVPLVTSSSTMLGGAVDRKEPTSAMAAPRASSALAAAGLHIGRNGKALGTTAWSNRNADSRRVFRPTNSAHCATTEATQPDTRYTSQNTKRVASTHTHNTHKGSDVQRQSSA